MAFADALTAASRPTSVMVDRRHAPGGHWNDGYPFLRLHQPVRVPRRQLAAPLGGDSIGPPGLERGLYERASGAEICGYYDRVMQQKLLPSGPRALLPDVRATRARRRFASRMSGERFEVKVEEARWSTPPISSRRFRRIPRRHFRSPPERAAFR